MSASLPASSEPRSWPSRAPAPPPWSPPATRPRSPTRRSAQPSHDELLRLDPAAWAEIGCERDPHPGRGHPRRVEPPLMHDGVVERGHDPPTRPRRRPAPASSGVDVAIGEPDVSPMQIQRLRSAGVIDALFGRAVRLDPIALVRTESDGIPVLVSRPDRAASSATRSPSATSGMGMPSGTGCSPPASPSGSSSPGRRTSTAWRRGSSPFAPDMDDDFIGKATLTPIRDKGVKQRPVGIEILGEPAPPLRGAPAGHRRRSRDRRRHHRGALALAREEHRVRDGRRRAPGTWNAVRRPRARTSAGRRDGAPLHRERPRYRPRRPTRRGALRRPAWARGAVATRRPGARRSRR